MYSNSDNSIGQLAVLPPYVKLFSSVSHLDDKLFSKEVSISFVTGRYFKNFVAERTAWCYYYYWL